MRALVIAAVALVASRAQAYPQFQLSTGAARCNQCHYAPAGGGLINGFGREEAADTISAGGNGSFLHGLWDPPSWLALGGDLRLAGAMVHEGATDSPEVAFFPMQADSYARAQVKSLSLYVNLGYRGAARSRGAQLYSRFVSREHYLMWRPQSVGAYVRAGRFFAPYGLRVAEHPSFVRRVLGFNTLEETYNLSGGWVSDVWELHATAFVPDFVRPVGHRGKGGAAYYERRFGEALAAGAQARVAVGDEDTRAQGGLVGKYFLGKPDILLLAQLDVVSQSFDRVDASRWQLVGYLGASWMFRRGFMAQAVLERFDEDLAVEGVARSALALELQWFPTAHVEVLLYGRGQIIGTGDGGDGLAQVLLQVHYYL